jgi:DNA-binding NarL/FixJ family response regulator
MHCLVIDDEYLPRGGTTVTLERIDPGIKVTEASCLDEAYQALERTPEIELVVLDLNLGASKGIETLKSLNKWCGDRNLSPRIVVLSGAGDDNPALVLDVLDTHGTGFILKNTSKPIFENALRLTLAGGIFIPKEILREIKLPLPAPSILPPDQQTTDLRALTPREREISKLLIKGWSYKKIANALVGIDGARMAEATVRRHVGNIAAKFNVGNGVRPRSGVMARLASLGVENL